MAARTRETPQAGAETAQAPTEVPTGHVVKAAMVTARDKAGRPFSLFAGDRVTDKIGAESLEHLKALGFVNEA